MAVSNSALKDSPRAGRTIGLCFLVVLLEGFDFQALGLAAPLLMPELGLAPDQAGFVFGLGMIGLVFGSLVGGPLADRVPRRTLLCIATALFGAATLATIAIHDLQSLLIARIATAFGLGSAMPVLVSIALEASPPKWRARSMTAMLCGLPIGGIVAATFASFALEVYGWRSIFVVGGILPLLLMPAIALFLPKGDPPGRGARAKRNNPVQTLFGEARALVSSLLWAAFGLTFLILYLLLNWLPSLTEAKGFAPSVGAMVAAIFNAGSVFGALVVGALVDRFGPRWPLCGAYVGLVASLAALAMSAQLWGVAISSFAAGFCLLGAQFSLYGVAPLYYPAPSRGVAIGAAMSVGRLGSIAGPILAGVLMSEGLGPGEVIGLLAPIATLAGIFVFAMIARAGEARAN